MNMMIVVLLFPTEPDPTKETMNYTVVVWGGILLLSTVYYFLPVIGGRHWFNGPARTLIEGLDINDGSDYNSEKQSNSEKRSHVDDKSL